MHIYYNTLDASGKWGNSWSEVPGNGVTNAALAVGVYNRRGYNNKWELYLFHKGINTHIYYNTLDASECGGIAGVRFLEWCH